MAWFRHPTHTPFQGISCLGCSCGTSLISYEHSWRRPQAEHQVLLDRIPSLPDLQSAWSLLAHCAASRANYFLRVVPPELGEEFAIAHDTSLWACLCNMMGISEGRLRSHRTRSRFVTTCPGWTRSQKCLQNPPLIGQVGLIRCTWCKSAILMSSATSSPQLEGVPVGHSLTSASAAARSLDGVHGFDIPSWRSLAAGARPPLRDPEDHEPWLPAAGLAT